MIDVKRVEDFEANGSNEVASNDYRECLKNRGGDPQLVDQLLRVNQTRKSLIAEKEALRAQQNQMGPQIVQLKKQGANTTELLKQLQLLAEQLKQKDAAVVEIENELNQRLLNLPNFCHSEVPVGSSEQDNKLIKSWGSTREFKFKPLEHYEIGERLGILDFDRATKVTGSRFCFLRGAAAQLERGLIQWMMDVHHRDHGYEEMIPPFIVNSQSLQGTGQFPKFREDVFHIESSEYHLVPTAEVPVTNFFRDEILDDKNLPQYFCAYSPCFRSEAGSYGRDTKGLIRQHQFDKVELVMFTRPEESYEHHEKMLSHAEKILQLLELPYRVMLLCTKDMGFAAAKCYDLEVWLPGQNAFREISSCSNCEDFQARRANIRFRPNAPKAKPRFVHTLNGSGLAVGRTLIAVLENYQQEDGSVKVPSVLKPYLGGRDLID